MKGLVVGLVKASAGSLRFRRVTRRGFCNRLTERACNRLEFELLKIEVKAPRADSKAQKHGVRFDWLKKYSEILPHPTNHSLVPRFPEERGQVMENPVVHFEIIGKNPKLLRDYYEKLFGWRTSIDLTVAPEVSDKGSYGFIERIATGDGTGIPGGIGGGQGFRNCAFFYVAVQNVETALRRAEDLGGKRILGPVTKAGGKLSVGHFLDPEGNLIGVAGPE
jgi:predicted enzyme related to lactoylglutathione lyase